MKSIFSRKFKINNKFAFSLIELSIVITIVSVVITGVIAVSITKINNLKVEAAQNRINTIYKAIGLYLTTNSRLPCPAPITTVKTSSSNYGNSAGAAGTCSESGVYTSVANPNIVYGMIPVQDLGLGAEMAEDGFGNKLAYVVDRRFTSTSTFGASASNSGLLMTVTEITTGGNQNNTQENTTEAILLIIGYGSNKSGAFNANSSTQNTASSDSNEIANYAVPVTDTTATLGNTFYSNVRTSNVFDDKIFYKTRNALVTDFNALYLIPCEPLAINSGDVTYGDYTMTWPSAAYGKIVTSTGKIVTSTGPTTTNVGDGKCPAGYTGSVDKPTKKCGAYGKWQKMAISPCIANGGGTGGGGSGGGGGGSGSSPSCTGGTSTTSGSKTVHTFTTVGSNSSLVCTGSVTITYLIVGGGGGGGGYKQVSQEGRGGGGGGGGGGGVKTGNYVVSDQTITVTVGAGGTGGISHADYDSSSGTSGGTGGTSSLGAIASATGGLGGKYGNGSLGNGGNSGVGNSTTAKKGGLSGTCPSATYTGGYAPHGGGGGGASMASNGTAGTRLTTDPSHGGGAGAAGTSNSITGSPVVYGGGGGGGAGGVSSEGSSNPVQGGGAGGLGGGGIGNRNNINNPGPGTNGLGGGGGGGGQADNGAAGGSGVVIVSYPTP